jgi:hypothetical protein
MLHFYLYQLKSSTHPSFSPSGQTQRLITQMLNKLSKAEWNDPEKAREAMI